MELENIYLPQKKQESSEQSIQSPAKIVGHRNKDICVTELVVQAVHCTVYTDLNASLLNIQKAWEGGRAIEQCQTQDNNNRIKNFKEGRTGSGNGVIHGGGGDLLRESVEDYSYLYFKPLMQSFRPFIEWHDC